jgi:hypothetical protein
VASQTESRVALLIGMGSVWLKPAASRHRELPRIRILDGAAPL